MHVAWEVQTNPTYTITLTLRGEELAEFHRLVCEADKSLYTTPCQGSILRDLSDAIREATQQEK
jgi:hypothetical protein